MLNKLGMNRLYPKGYSLFVLKGAGRGIACTKLIRGVSLK